MISALPPPSSASLRTRGTGVPRGGSGAGGGAVGLDFVPESMRDNDNASHSRRQEAVTKRFVIAQIKHETNTFSPIGTPLAAFGHGNGPLHGEDASRALAGPNSPFAAFLDVAAREGAEAVTPIAAEALPPNPASRETFEALEG